MQFIPMFYMSGCYLNQCKRRPHLQSNQNTSACLLLFTLLSRIFDAQDSTTQQSSAYLCQNKTEYPSDNNNALPNVYSPISNSIIKALTWSVVSYQGCDPPRHSAPRGCSRPCSGPRRWQRLRLRHQRPRGARHTPPRPPARADAISPA